MQTAEEIRQALKNDYPLIPMKDITDEARMIAIAWMECGDKRWIVNKHKLASDIMNYSRRYASSISAGGNDGWIDVKDCLPAIFKNVFGFSKRGDMVICSRDSSGKFDDYPLTKENDKITHWRPLPEPPSQQVKH